MSGEWENVRIQDIAERVAMGPFGSSIKVSTFVTDGVPVISGQHLKGTRLDDREFNFVTEEHAGRLKSANVQRGDIVFTHAGSIGQAAYIPTDSMYNRYVLSQRQFSLRLDIKRAIPEYVVYYFHSYAGRHKLLANTSQTGVPSIAQPVTYLRSIEIPLPPLPEQRRIAKILGDLDDKIELNRKMNETLEQMARALFKSWFVDFDPVRAKMEGRTPTGMDAATAALFPDRLVDSELGPIPEGWEVKALGEVMEVTIGRTPPRKEAEWFSTSHDDIPWISIRDLGDAEVFVSDTAEKLTHSALERFNLRVIPKNTVVLSFKLTVGRVAITDREMLSNEAIAHFRPREPNPLSKEYLYCYLLGYDYNGMGSTSSIATAVNSEMVRQINLLIPNHELDELFSKRVQSLFQSINLNIHQSRTLSTLRDTLLPKLVGGEVRV